MRRGPQRGDTPLQDQGSVPVPLALALEHRCNLGMMGIPDKVTMNRDERKAAAGIFVKLQEVSPA